jgi:hypothetical protein
MDVKKVLIGGILGGVVYFFLGWLLWGVILKETMAAPADIQSVIEIPEEEMRISFMAISCIVWGIFIAFIFNKWASISTFMGGLKGGAIIGVFVSLTVGTAMYSMYTFTSLQNIALDTITNAVASGITGGVIGWYLGR